eukprot:scaffold293861_cov28-Tisochrysis_lutea.AAC.3
MALAECMCTEHLHPTLPAMRNQVAIRHAKRVAQGRPRQRAAAEARERQAASHSVIGKRKFVDGARPYRDARPGYSSAGLTASFLKAAELRAD